MPRILTSEKSERFWFRAIILWVAWVSLEFIPIGRLSLLRVSDVADTYIPVLMAKKLEAVKYGFSYWSNFILSGTDNWAWCEEPFHFFDFLAFFCPTWLWHFLMMVTQRFLAALFSYKLCRENLQFPPWISFLCGAAYSVTFWPQREFFYFYGFGMPGIAFFIWVLPKLRKFRDFWNYIISFAVGLVFAFTTYLPGGPIFFLPIIFLWGVLIDGYQDRRYLISFACFTLGSMAVDLPYVIASVFYLPMSTRATLDLRLPGTVGNLKGNGIWPNYFDLILSFWREHSVFISVALGGYFFAVTKRARRLLNVTIVLAFFCVVIAPLYLPLHHQLSSMLQSFRGFGFYRFYLAGPFLVIMGFGCGLMTFSSGRVGRKILIATAVLSAALVFYQSIRIKVNAYRTYANYSLMFERFDLQKLKQQTEGEQAFRVATAFTEDRWLPHFALYYGFEIADGYLSVYSKRYHDFWGKVIEPLISKDPQKNIYFHNWRNKAYLFSPTSKSPSVNATELTIDHDNPEVFSDHYNLNLLSLANVRFLFSRRPLQDSNLKLISREGDLGDWSRRSKWDRFIGLWKGEYRGHALYIYENQNYLPRLFLAGKVQVFDTAMDLLQEMEGLGVEKLKEVVLTSHDQPESESIRGFKGSDDGQIQIKTYTPDFVSLNVQNSESTILVHLMSFTPYWRAYIDGQRKPIFPAYHAFQGVVIPKGNHKVILEYCPPYRFCDQN